MLSFGVCSLSSFAECCGDADADFVAEQEVGGGECYR